MSVEEYKIGMEGVAIIMVVAFWVGVLVGAYLTEKYEDN